MSTYAVERALLCRAALGIKGCPTTHDVWRLLDLVTPAVDLWWQPAGSPAALYSRFDGKSTISLPVYGSDSATAAMLLEELAHWFCRSRTAIPQGVGAMDRYRESGEEVEAAGFSAAWLLPDEVLSACRDENELWSMVDEGNVSEQILTTALDRWRERRTVWLGDRLPGWSALNTHSIIVRRGVNITLLIQGPHVDAELPVGEDPDQAIRWEMGRLAALREDEAPLVYAEQVVMFEDAPFWQRVLRQ